MNEKLKPCPFCGGEVKKIYYYDGFGGEYFGVHCERCRFTYGAETEYKRNTVNRWNTRAAGWIKTRERLPEVNEDVLAFLEDEKRIYIGFMNIFDEWRLYDYSEQSWGITHEAEDIPYWMPLPELPEVEE